MNVLTFEHTPSIIAGRRIRRTKFEPRSALPVAAACLVANAMRETLTSLVAAPVSVRLFAPVLPRAAAWPAITERALAYCVRGPALEAAIVLRPRDAVALATLAFGETSADERQLSAIEKTVVERAVDALIPALAPVCGFRDRPRTEPARDLTGFATYFEVLVERPVQLRIGIALSRDPVPPAGARIRVEDLLDVELEVRVEFARGVIDAAALLSLGKGTEVPMKTRVSDAGVLRIDDAIVATGECGAIGQCGAMVVRQAANGVLL